MYNDCTPVFLKKTCGFTLDRNRLDQWLSTEGHGTLNEKLPFLDMEIPEKIPSV